jgi:hypothetical protein
MRAIHREKGRCRAALRGDGPGRRATHRSRSRGVVRLGIYRWYASNGSDVIITQFPTMLCTKTVSLFKNSCVGIAETLRGAVGSGSVDGVAVRRRSRSRAGLRYTQVVSRRAVVQGVRGIWTRRSPGAIDRASIRQRASCLAASSSRQTATPCTLGDGRVADTNHCKQGDCGKPHGALVQLAQRNSLTKFGARASFQA